MTFTDKEYFEVIKKNVHSVDDLRRLSMWPGGRFSITSGSGAATGGDFRQL